MIKGNGISLRAPRIAAGARRGFSLIEIMVVLVILVIGILALVRLFPYGFLTIQRTGEQTAASALGQQQIAALRNQPTPPADVRSALPKLQGDIQLLDTVEPDDLAEASANDLTALQAQYNFTLPANYGPYFYSDINRIRYIQGETFNIPIATPNGVSSQYGSVYTLQYGPVYNQFFTDPVTSDNRDSINVRGKEMSRIVLSSVGSTLNQPDPTPNIVDENHYAIDYVNNQIAFFPRLADPKRGVAVRVFNLTYSYYTGTTGPGAFQTATIKISVNDLPVDAAGNPLLPEKAVWQSIPVLANTAMQPYSEQVSRSFRLVSQQTVEQTGTAPNFSNDPYEYAWYSQQEGNVNRGVLIFNPRGHVTLLDPTNKVKSAADYANDQTIPAQIDYLTYDNHIIRDDRAMPSAAPYRVKLSLGLILGQDDILPNKYVYAGLYTDPTIDNTGVNDAKDLVVLNMSTGQEICDIINGVSTPTSLVPAVLDAKDGILTFGTRDASAQIGSLETQKLQPLKGAPLRILYRTQKQWGMQVQKAAANYSVIVPTANTAAAANAAFAQIDATHCLPGPGNGLGTPTRIYFAISELGKTVTIGDLYYLKTGADPTNQNSYQHETNQTLRISDTTESIGLTSGPAIYAYIDISTIFPNVDPTTGLSALPTGRAVNFVQGLSVKSRIIWQDVARWRRVDTDTTVQVNQ